MERRLVAEALGTAFLLAAIVGSGIMAQRLASGNAGIALLANTVATGSCLSALILTFGAISGWAPTSHPQTGSRRPLLLPIRL